MPEVLTEARLSWASRGLAPEAGILALGKNGCGAQLCIQITTLHACTLVGLNGLIILFKSLN